jgi:hypothetical protein
MDVGAASGVMAKLESMRDRTCSDSASTRVLFTWLSMAMIAGTLAVTVLVLYVLQLTGVIHLFDG